MTGVKDNAFDLVVIGAGPGGYVAAIRAAQLGLKVACVEKDNTLGGTCLNVGCIPSKALLESTLKYHDCRHNMEIHGITVGELSYNLAAMMARKEKLVTTLTKGIDQLFGKNNITRYTGPARLYDNLQVEVAGEKAHTLRGKAVLIATGSKPAGIPGVTFDGKRIITSTEALALNKVPNHLVVVGGGAIGLELSSVWLRLGAKVTVLEAMEGILPAADKTIAKQALRLLKKQGMKFLLGAPLERIEAEDGSCRIEVSGHEPLTADKVLIAVGRKPCLDDLGFKELGGTVDKHGYIVVDDAWQTSVQGIFAIGDVIGGAMLAHKASDEAIACVEQLVTGYGRVNYRTIPYIVYTHPEIASVGQTEDELAEKKVPYKTGVFYFKGNGRAMAIDDTDGMVKVITHKDTDRILGVHIIGPRAGDLIAEAVVAMECGAAGEDLARICHAHPTLSEVLREAALNVGTGAIHG